MTNPPATPSAPECQAAMWDFLARLRDGTAAPSPDDFGLACVLAEMWHQREVMLTSLTRRITPAAADALVAEAVEQRRGLYTILSIPPLRVPQRRAETLTHAEPASTPGPGLPSRRTDLGGG